MGADNLFVIYAGWMMRGYDFLHPDVVSYDVTLEDGMWRDAFGHPINEEAVTVNDDGITGRVVLPAQPHAGGDQGLQEAANAIRELGFLFGLHDNYQDIYGDAPSFHPERYIT